MIIKHGKRSGVVDIPSSKSISHRIIIASLLSGIEVKDELVRGWSDDLKATRDCLRAILSKYDVDISQRYKGLGEVKPQLMFYSTLNPKVRKLVRLTMEDREQVLREMRILHGEKFAEERRQILLNMELDPDDIDN